MGFNSGFKGLSKESKLPLGDSITIPILRKR